MEALIGEHRGIWGNAGQCRAQHQGAPVAVFPARLWLFRIYSQDMFAKATIA